MYVCKIGLNYQMVMNGGPCVQMLLQCATVVIKMSLTAKIDSDVCHAAVSH